MLIKCPLHTVCFKLSFLQLFATGFSRKLHLMERYAHIIPLWPYAVCCLATKSLSVVKWAEVIVIVVAIVTDTN